MVTDVMRGVWKLTRPDGRVYEADSPLRCVAAERDERIPADVQLARILAAAAEPDFAERHVQLGKFYGAANVDDLVDMMERHITKLQEKQAATQPPFSFAPPHVREG